MTIIETLNNGESGLVHRTKINDNFSDLNSGKVETTTTINGKALNTNITLDKTDIGLSNVENTSDLSKPISTATQNALDLKRNISDSYSQTETNTLLDGKVDKVIGKELSENDFTDTLKTKLDNIEAGAEVNTLNDVIAGTNITIDKTDPLNPVISSTASGGATDFTDLGDVPASYTGQAGKFTKVNATEDGLEFSTIPGGGDLVSTNNLSDLANITTARDNLDVYSTTEVDTALDLKQNLALTNLASTNLNTIVTNGKYCANSTCTNLPETSVKTRLIVNVDPTNSDLVMQEALTTTTQVSYVRTTTNGGSTWTAWARIKATDETKVSLTGNETIAGVKTFSDRVDVNKTLRSTGIEAPTSGTGVEVRYDGTGPWGTIIAYDRTAAAYKDLQLNGLIHISTNNRVGIGSGTPTASAKFQIDSTSQGFLPPRMTTAQRNAISSPATGLHIENTTDNKYQRYNGTTWENIGAGAITTSGLTQATNKLLGRNTAGTGAVEEITLGTGLSFTGTTLNATGGSSKTNLQIPHNTSGFTTFCKTIGGASSITYTPTSGKVGYITRAVSNGILDRFFQINTINIGEFAYIASSGLGVLFNPLLLDDGDSMGTNATDSTGYIIGFEVAADANITPITTSGSYTVPSGKIYVISNLYTSATSTITNAFTIGGTTINWFGGINAIETDMDTNMGFSMILKAGDSIDSASINHNGYLIPDTYIF